MEVIGFDAYNQQATGGVSMTLTALRSDFHHVPCVCIGFDSYNLCLTGEVGRTLTTPSGGLNEHIPVIIEEKDETSRVLTAVYLPEETER